jgi:hypothetical protein
MFVCCVLSGTGLGDELISRPRGVLPTVARRVCDQETSWYEEARWAAEPEKIINNHNYFSSAFLYIK